jgi:salicylate hydroxylase
LRPTEINEKNITMRVLITGSGLAGLSAAVCFAKRGDDVQLFERNPQLSPRGGGINIRPTASRIMHSWGLEKDLEAVSERTPSTILHDLYSGEIAVRNIAINASEHPDWGTTRKAVIELLYRNACDLGVVFHFNATVVSVVDDAQHAMVTLEDNRSISADIVIAADGVKSRLRSMILADLGANLPMEPIVDPTTFYGLEVGSSELGRRLGEPGRLMENMNIHCWMGNGNFVVTRFAPKLDSVACLFGIQSETDQKGLWDENGDIEYVRKSFTGSCHELMTVLNLADTCDRWRLVEMPELPRWSSKASRIILLGDSAHAMHPNAAQGFSTTVEDIGVLEYLLSQPESGRQMSVPEAITFWESLRKPRVERIKKYAKWNTQRFSGSVVPPVDNVDRTNVKDLQNVVPDENGEFHSSAFLKWALDHDAIGLVSSSRDRWNSCLDHG